MKANKLNLAVRTAMALGVMAAYAMPVVAHAADNAAAKQDDTKTERIEVTGSRIKRQGALSPTPLTVISGDVIQDMGITNVADLLNKLPQSTVGISPETSNNTIFANGLNQTDLRGLGTARTLVLVNGRRYVAGSAGDTAVDLNNLPTTMIERVEIITGGASAVYGSDAVAGVVNIITRKKTDGLELDASYTQPEQKGGAESQYSLAYGTDFLQGKGSVMMSAVYAEAKQIKYADRDFTRNPVGSIYNSANTGPNDGEPTKISYTGRKPLSWINEAGTFFTSDNQYTWDTNGNLKPFDYGDGLIPGPGTNGNYCTGACEGYDPVNYNVIRTPLKRQVYNLNADYQINDDMKLFTELTYSNYKSYGESSPVFHQGVPIWSDNAFLSDDARNIIDADGGVVGMYRIDTEFGNRKYNQNRDTFRALVGLEGYIGDWSYSVFYQEGHLKEKTHWTGEIFADRYYQAFDSIKDANGNIVCRDQSNGCVPLNLLGQGQASQEAIDWVSTDAHRVAKTEQKNAGFVVSGDLFELPAGALSTAISGEWRREQSRTTPDDNMINGLIFGNTSAKSYGAYEVSEAAVEFSVPVLADVFLAKEVNLDLAYRYMDYTSVGNNDAWKLGLNWSVTNDLKLRATKSKSVRAPNISELYDPPGQTFESITDVCDVDNINAPEASQYRASNCHAAGLPDGWKATDDWYHANHPGFNAGNADLKEETSDDYTVGFVYTPSFVEGLTLTADYWSFDIKNAINYIDVGTAVKYCYDSASLDNPYCSRFTRDPNTGDITSFVQSPINVATFKTKGVDIEGDYGFSTESAGNFRINLLATYVDDWRTNPTGFASDLEVDVGEYTNPRLKGRFSAIWTYDKWTVNAVADYRHHAVGNRKSTIESNNYNDIPSSTVWDFTGRYAFDEHLELRFGVKNAFDKAPPRNPYTYDGAGYYDTLGRAYFLGANYAF
ncbi:TonB-dependent receptor [Gallaecimonas kandeliae]|uniref:TonB-dependent receptor plug domain-containing protein n=1 Tax=Gallaecimonas kandeliae TaxID=3029055 RepID=UPI002647A029|nr:TonB-dependent receptor [Gallaecimonas kandeliae]WKE64910.1 TonB-dependent receptor [Gallaecimonas kandeliae]